jgi:hypothetical protein
MLTLPSQRFPTRKGLPRRRSPEALDAQRRLNVDDVSHPWWDGETDFWETGVDHSDWSAFVHYESPATQAFCEPEDLDWRPLSATSWHDVALEWEPTRLQVTVDGYVEASCRWTDPAMIADWPQRLTFQLDAMDPELGDTVVRMEIDRVAIYTGSSPR